MPCRLWKSQYYRTMVYGLPEPSFGWSHQKGAHGYGAMMGGGRTSYHHNLIAHHDSRTPRYVFRSTDPTTKEHPTDWRNNVIYN